LRVPPSSCTQDYLPTITFNLPNQVLAELQTAMGEIIRLREERDAAFATVEKLSELLEDITSTGGDGGGGGGGGVGGSGGGGSGDGALLGLTTRRIEDGAAAAVTANHVGAKDDAFESVTSAVVTEFSVDAEEWPHTTHFCSSARARELEARGSDGSRGDVVVVLTAQKIRGDHRGTPAAVALGAENANDVPAGTLATTTTNSDDGGGGGGGGSDDIESLHVALLARDGTEQGSADEADRLAAVMDMMSGQKKDDPLWEVRVAAL